MGKDSPHAEDTTSTSKPPMRAGMSWRSPSSEIRSPTARLLDQPHQIEIVLRRSSADQDEVERYRPVLEQRARLQEVGVILHRPDHRNLAEHDRLGTQAERAAQLLAGSRPRTEAPAVESVRDDRRALVVVAEFAMLSLAGTGHVDDFSRPSREIGAQADQAPRHPFLVVDVVDRVMNAPDERGQGASQRPRQAGGQIAVIHPTLHNIRGERDQSLADLPGGVERRMARLKAAVPDACPGLAERLGEHAVSSQCHDAMPDAVLLPLGDDVQQHAFGAAGAHRRRDVQILILLPAFGPVRSPSVSRRGATSPI